MPPEEPDTATVGTEAPSPGGASAPRRHRVAVFVGVAALTVAGALAVFVIVEGGGRESARETAAAPGPSRASGEGVTPDGSAPDAHTTTTSSTSVPTPPTAPLVAPSPGAPEPVDLPGPGPVTTAAWAPGTPVVSIGAPGPGGCPAWWTVDDGGRALAYYVVTLESAPAPPGADGTEIGTALRAEKTTATTATVDVGGTIRVTAENALGSGPTSGPLICR